MKKTFGVQNADIVAEAQLTRLTQGTGSTLDYTNRFMELAADIEWNDPAKISAYRKGLNPEVLRISVSTPHSVSDDRRHDLYRGDSFNRIHSRGDH